MFFASSGVLALTMKTTPFPSVRKYHWSILPARYAFTVSCTSCGMIWARWAGVMGVPMKWEIARIFVVGTGGSGFCAEAAPSGVIGFFCMGISRRVAPLGTVPAGTIEAFADLVPWGTNVKGEKGGASRSKGVA